MRRSVILLQLLLVVGVTPAWAHADSRMPGGHAEPVQTATYRVGPVDLPAYAGYHSIIGASWQKLYSMNDPRIDITIPQDGWLLAFVPRLVDAQGHPLPGLLLHHALLYNRGSATHHVSYPASVLIGMGIEQDLTPIHFPEGYGIPVKAGDHLELIAMFANPFEEPYSGVQFEATMTFQDRQAGLSAPKTLVPVWFGVEDDGEGTGYWVPPGSHERSRQVAFPISGRLILMWAHLHTHARWLTLEDESRRRVIWRARPEQRPDGRLVRVPIWISRRGLHVASGRMYRVAAKYDNPTSRPIDAMANLGIYVHPDSDQGE